MKQELLIERMTWPEVRSIIEKGFTSVVIACGAIEQHGPHLPLNMDTMHGDELAREIALYMGHTLVAPTIRIGLSEEHIDFAGTITLAPETFRMICLDYCKSLARHGFRQICLVPSHGGNFKPLADMLHDLREAVGPGIQIDAFTDMTAVLKMWKRVIKEENGPEDHVGGHADIAESSIMLAIAPDSVRKTKVEQGYTGAMTKQVKQSISEKGIQSVALNGILGNPRGMTKSIGRKCIKEFAKMAGSFFTAYNQS